MRRRASKTTTSRSSRRAYRRSTSSIWTTPPGTPPPTRSTRPQRAAWRLWEKCSPPRGEKSKPPGDLNHEGTKQPRRKSNHDGTMSTKDTKLFFVGLRKGTFVNRVDVLRSLRFT